MIGVVCNSCICCNYIMCRAVVALWRPEYASYMVEGTPGRPYGHRMAHFNLVEANMKIRLTEFHYNSVYTLTHSSVISFPSRCSSY